MPNNNGIRLHVLPNDDNFDETAYLAANPDVQAAVITGLFADGKQHFMQHGKSEGRLQYYGSKIGALKTAKRARIREHLRSDLSCIETDECLDFLSSDLREQFNIVDTTAVSSHEYAPDALALIEKHRTGLVLDCGAGSRPVYYPNVVNLEIAAYPSTDVRAVGEVLPFQDNTFDAIFSLAVLEHVKDPWRCAREIIRVLKPGGDLLCCVPFLQPLHGYPHHYYNMSGQGLRNLFAPHIDIDRHEVPGSGLPIWSLTWILKSWGDGLDDEARAAFFDLKIGDLLDNPENYMQKPFVTGLSTEKNFELASTTIFQGRKRG